jgi:hypothetical protein
MDWYLYLLAAVLILVAVLRSRSAPKNQLRARDISGNVSVGDVSGTLTQTGAAPPPADPKPDRVAWLIGIVGVLIAVATLAYTVIHDLAAK